MKEGILCFLQIDTKSSRVTLELPAALKNKASTVLLVESFFHFVVAFNFYNLRAGCGNSLVKKITVALLHDNFRPRPWEVWQ